MKLNRIVMTIAILFAFCSVTLAAEYWVIRDKSEKMVVVETKPTDTSVIVKGPFPTRAEAEVIISGPAGSVVVPVPPATAVPPAAAPKAPPPPPPPPGR